MKLITLAITTLVVSGVVARPRESTHQLLTRLGFDPVQKPGINLHKKRVVDEADKGRHQAYNSDSDSHLYVVRLPPHQPYYSHTKPEIGENDVMEKPMNLPLNGKPAQVYHWNLPLMKKLAKHKKKNKHDSKIVHLKIKATKYEDFYHKLKKDGKPNVYKIKHDLNNPQNDMPAYKTHFEESRKIQKDSALTFIKNKSHKGNSIVNYLEEKKITKLNPALVYSPAIPKDNSFHKYFPGNGKPKSFYVIEKGAYTGQPHKLL